jgi:hypothetical protein
MKHIATVALMLHLGVVGVYAQQKPVKMTASGTIAATTINLQPNTNTDEQNLAGNGTLGPFTFRELHADPASPQPSSTCSGPTHLYFPNVAGGGVFRFQDGSLLTVGGHGGIIPLHRSHGGGGPPYHDLSDHRWNRAFQGCVRHPYVDGDVVPGVV